MKNIYVPFLKNGLLCVLLFLITNKSVFAQCPDGHPQGGTAYDTTILFETGITSTPVKFPQFNPENGMVTCVKLCITITGVVDTLHIENLSASPQIANFVYNRSDAITGPGIIAPLTNTINETYGPYNLTPYDGSIGSGTDRVARGKDTVLNTQLCRTISDETTIEQFYGSDSITYNYTIDVSANASMSGGSAFILVLTSALVNFHFEYCTCPSTTLPLSVKELKTTKISNTKTELQWTASDDPLANYHYEVEVSRNSINFTTIGKFEKNTKTTDPYKMLFTAPNGESGSYYFRIKQVYSNGYVRYSNISHVLMESPVNAKFSLYPNPSNGVVGIKFDSYSTGRFDVQIFNAQGQLVVNKSIVANGSSYMQVAKLNSGSYWLRLTDRETQSSCINQLLIK